MLTEINVDVEMIVKFSYRGVGELKDGMEDDDSIGVFIEKETCDLFVEMGFENVDVCITDLRVERSEVDEVE